MWKRFSFTNSGTLAEEEGGRKWREKEEKEGGEKVKGGKRGEGEVGRERVREGGKDRGKGGKKSVCKGEGV